MGQPRFLAVNPNQERMRIMTHPLNGKKALVTGGSRGIGEAIARRFADDGASVAINYHRASDRAEALVNRIEEAGGTAAAFRADIADTRQVAELFDRVLDRFGRIDILVNNAGIARYGPIADYREADFDRLFGVNVKGVFFACREAANRLADNGRVINIGSTVTRVMLPGYGAYAASKGAVEQITRVLAAELGPRGITVNAVCPGPVDTELFREGKTQEQIDRLARMAALNRLGDPGDVADAAAMLAGESGRWISGQCLYVNGGFA
jgi:3-oxoacyl-[acyl-carrier protein] reductase